MIELNKNEQLIMAVLAKEDNTEQYVLSLINISQGKLKRAGIFICLQSLEDKGLIESRKEVMELPHRSYKFNRTFYKLTSSGIAKSEFDSKEIK